MALNSETRGIIESLLQNNRVVLFMKGTPQQPQCGFSATTVSTLEMLVPDYMTVNVLEHPEIRDGIKEFSNWPTIPQLYVKGELIGGSDIVQDMLSSGELGDVLGVTAPNVEPPEIHISESATEVMKNAIQSQEGANLHLQISAAWNHILSLDPSKTGAVQVEIAGIPIHMDPWSAARAGGLGIELDETLTGKSFVFENPNAPPPVKQLSVDELKKKLDGDGEVLLIDVRGPEERAVELIERSVPWNDETMARVEALPKDAEIIFHCQTGPRSQALAEQFRSRGYTNLSNVTGGMSAWSKEIDADD
jgi:monothiol glutaredoxin